MHKDRSSVSAADMEPNSSNGTFRKNEFAPLDTPCRINIHSVRKRLTDPDGVSAKAAIDGLVHGGILIDDSPEFVKSVTYTQEKAVDEEYTVITITELT